MCRIEGVHFVNLMFNIFKFIQYWPAKRTKYNFVYLALILFVSYLLLITIALFILFYAILLNNFEAISTVENISILIIFFSTVLINV